jgi:hypothetical protein
MFDHIVNYASEAAAITEPALAAYYDAESSSWRGDVVLPGVKVYRVTGYQTITDPDTDASWEHEIRQDFPGWFAMLALPAISEEIRDLPLGCCMLIADRDLADAGLNPLVFVSSTLSPSDLEMMHVSPIFAGSAGYPFSR